ncbi:inovirus-type Gp2 protein [Variovorax sp. PAMC26660]|uniref:YagK/YfjJ domain-containing protein n=1 Tax=Variovorax sp. PAMC26660 TaxID=2762322 RepID=UPI00164CE8B4|nr:inovirus-type Gp2 protein [Variovorax sp. PAMC26660]QNK67609.1 inovirus-type Gp2 protein [Variovorax sp. PAMC26660]
MEFLRREQATYMTDGYPISWIDHAHAELLVRHIHASNLFEQDLEWDFVCMDSDVAAQQIKLLNNVVYAIRSEGGSLEFKEKLRRQKDLVEQRNGLITKFLGTHFLNHRRILVLRVDLGWNTPAEGTWDALEGSVSYAEVREAREALIAYLRKRFPKTLVGYALRLEYGLDKGFHYHLLVLLKGSKHRRDELLAREIGEYWKEVITAQRGHYYNCHVNKESYRQRGLLGIGMIHRRDPLGRKNLERTACYLRKHDPFIKAHMPQGDLTFWRSEMPEKNIVRRGRPPKKRPALSKPGKKPNITLRPRPSSKAKTNSRHKPRPVHRDRIMRLASDPLA